MTAAAAPPTVHDMIGVHGMIGAGIPRARGEEAR
jgi:hypothetical protein